MTAPPAGQRLLYPFGAKLLQPGDFGGQVVGMDVQVHPARAVAEPLDEQPEFCAVERGAVVLGVSVESGQRLADSCAPERQLAVVIGSWDINHDLGQPAVVSHPVNLRSLTGRLETGTAWQRTRSGMSAHCHGYVTWASWRRLTSSRTRLQVHGIYDSYVICEAVLLNSVKSPAHALYAPLLIWPRGEWNLPGPAGPSRRWNWWSRQPTAVKAAAITAIGAVAAALVVGLPAALIASRSSSPSQLSSSSSPSVSPSGIITNPPNGASNVAAHKNLRLSGTAQNIPSGYRLDLFLQFANVSRYYVAADPNSAISLHNGHWIAPIFIGASGSIIIRLVLLSPSEIAYVNSQVTYQNAGFPTLPGTVLASASYTAQ